MLPIAGIPLSLNDFAEQFSEVFSHPAQVGHFKEMLVGLLVSDNRTIAGIHQRLIDGDEYDALRKLLSRSPWTAEKLQEERLKWIKENLPKERESPTVVAIDPSFIYHTGKNIFVLQTEIIEQQVALSPVTKTNFWHPWRFLSRLAPLASTEHFL